MVLSAGTVIEMKPCHPINHDFLNTKKAAIQDGVCLRVPAETQHGYRFPYKKGIFIIWELTSRTDHTLQLNGWKKELLIGEGFLQLSYRSINVT